MNTNSQAQNKISFWQQAMLILFGFLLTLALLETGLRLAGFIILSVQEHRNLQSIKHKGTYRIVCLGESTTTAAGWIPNDYAYPEQLEQILNDLNIGIRFSIINEGAIGTNTTAILNRLQTYLDRYHPDMVIAMMGINDKGAHMPSEYADSPGPAHGIAALKTYKLVRMLGLHIAAKTREVHVPSSKAKRMPVEAKDGTTSADARAQEKEIPASGQVKDSAVFYFEQGKQFWYEQEFSRAEEAFLKARELDPGNNRIYMELGICYWIQEQYPKAEKVFKELLHSELSGEACL